MGVFEFEVGDFLEEEGVLVGEFYKEVGSCMKWRVLMMERKVKIPRNIFLKSKSFTLLKTPFTAFRYFLIGSSYLSRTLLTRPGAQAPSRS